MSDEPQVEVHDEAVPVVEMRGIVKQFGLTVANDGVDFTLHAGEVHALLGENGAGKTTLMNMLFGMFEPDAGSIELNGQAVKLESPREALDLGVGMVHQHFMLVPDFTVAENVAFGSRKSTNLSFRKRSVEAEVGRVAQSFGMEIDPAATVGDLSIDLQQRIEILKLLYRGAEILILDEPTAVLGPAEVESLFRTLRQLASSGKSVVIITHKLREIMMVADRVTILRDGQLVDSKVRGEFDEASLAVSMIGHALPEAPQRSGGARPGAPVLVVEDLSVPADRARNAVERVSFTLHEGEITGVVGVEGNGQIELLHALCGLNQPIEGSITLDGRDLTGASPAEFYGTGLGVVTENRLTWDLISEMSVGDNLAASAVRVGKYSRFGLLDKKRIEAEARRLLEEYDVRPPRPEVPAGRLSGGNQQKVVIAREFSRDPKVLLVSQPTRGLDMGAADFVLRQLVKMRDRGCAILLNSSDLDEMMKVVDRVMVFYRGEVALEGEASALSLDQIAAAITGSFSKETV